MKVIGLSESKENTEIVINDNFIKENIYINNIKSRIRRLFKVTVIPKIINISRLENANCLLVLILLKFRILYLVHDNSEIQVYSSSIIKEFTIKAPIGINIESNEFTEKYLEKFKIKIKKIKASIEDTRSISINFWTNITFDYDELGDFWFLAGLHTSEENIFHWHNRKKKLIQKTFFNKNRIFSLDIVDGDGYILTEEGGKKSIYYLEDNRISKVPLINDEENLFLVFKIYNNLIVAVNTNNITNLYIYNYGKLEIFIENIYRGFKPVFIGDSLIYGRMVNKKLEIVRSYYKESQGDLERINEEIIVKLSHDINKFKVSKDKKNIVMLVNQSKILMYDCINKGLNEILINEMYRKIQDVFFTNEKNTLLLKVMNNYCNDIILVYLDKKFMKNITNNRANTYISSLFTSYNMSDIYLCDNSMYGYNIYKLNINSLKKELMLEINAKDIRFI